MFGLALTDSLAKPANPENERQIHYLRAGDDRLRASIAIRRKRMEPAYAHEIPGG
jgi:hypothetical protein